MSLFKFSGSAGVEIAHFIKNDDKSYVVPITTFNIDFDDTLSKNKRISNNAKLGFEAVFDLGQKVSASVLDQDLVSYTYFTAGMNVRYNHSSKFGLEAEQIIPYKNINQVRLGHALTKTSQLYL